MLSKLLIAAVAAVASASSPEPVAVSRDAVAAKVNSLTSAVSESASKLERHERASVTRERMAQWTNFIADVEEHIPELLQDTATVAGASAQLYEPLDFPAFVAAAPPATSTWNPFEPWLVQLKAYRTYMANYIDYQITWVYKLKCTFTGDCNVHTTMAYAPAGATKIVLASTAGIEKDAKLMIPGTTSSATSFLETSTGSTTCYTVSAVSGQTVTLTTALAKEMAADTAVTKSTACLAASPSPAAATPFGSSSIKLVPAAALTQSSQINSATYFHPDSSLTSVITSTSSATTAAVAATTHNMILTFTPNAAVASGGKIIVTLGTSTACTYTVTAASTIVAAKVGSSSSFSADADWFAVSGGAVAAAGVAPAGATITFTTSAALVKGTEYSVYLGMADDASAAITTGFLTTPTTALACPADSSDITIKATTSADAAITGLEATAIVKSPKTADA